MKNQKLDRLFESARSERAPVPTLDFAGDVLRAIGREPLPSAPGDVTIFDQLNALFPRIALAAAAIILLSLAADYGLTAAGTPSLSESAAQISAQQFLPTDQYSL